MTKPILRACLSQAAAALLPGLFAACAGISNRTSAKTIPKGSLQVSGEGTGFQVQSEEEEIPIDDFPDSHAFGGAFTAGLTF